MHTMRSVLEAVEAGKTSFSPASDNDEGIEEFQALAKMLTHAAAQHWLDGRIHPYQNATTGRMLYYMVDVPGGLSHAGSLHLASLRDSDAASGKFIGVGDAFTAFHAIADVLRSARRDILIVDPYLSERALFDFVPTALEGVAVRLLVDARARNLHPALKVGVERWQRQHEATRPLAARYTSVGKLHDRIFTIDNSDVWLSTQSLKDIAARSPASVIRLEPAVAVLKREAHEALWVDATPL
jgi:hypothetical protein